jgi:hypothetical protein
MLRTRVFNVDAAIKASGVDVGLHRLHCDRNPLRGKHNPSKWMLQAIVFSLINDLTSRVAAMSHLSPQRALTYRWLDIAIAELSWFDR